MVIPKAKYTFTNTLVGTTSANGVTMSGWKGFSQDGTTVNTIVDGGTTNRLLSVSPYALWKQNYNVTTLYTDVDFTALVTLGASLGPPSMWMSPRTQADSAIIGTGYMATFTPNAGDGFGYVNFFKSCGSTAYSVATFQVPIFSNSFTSRLTIVGQVMTAYVNGVFVGDYDFTSFLTCGSNYTQGYLMIGPGDSNTLTFDPGDVTPTFNIV